MKTITISCLMYFTPFFPLNFKSVHFSPQSIGHNLIKILHSNWLWPQSLNSHSLPLIKLTTLSTSSLRISHRKMYPSGQNRCSIKQFMRERTCNTIELYEKLCYKKCRFLLLPKLQPYLKIKHISIFFFLLHQRIYSMNLVAEAEMSKYVQQNSTSRQ